MLNIARLTEWNDGIYYYYYQTTIVYIYPESAIDQYHLITVPLG